MTSKTVLLNSVIVLLFNTVLAQYNLRKWWKINIFCWQSFQQFFLLSFHISTIAEYIRVCHKNDPQLVQCMKRSVEGLRPYLRRGIKELDIPPIEPILIGDLIVSESVPGQGVSITARDVKAYGPSNFILKKLEWVIFSFYHCLILILLLHLI